MSRFEKDEQKPESYYEIMGVIKAKYREDGDEIAKECKRRNIRHYYDTSQDIVEDWPVDGYKIEIRETGLKVQELVDWVIMKFNTEESLNTYEGMIVRDEHKPEWYNENLIVIKARYRLDGDEIAKECKRRNIRHYYNKSQEIVDGWPVDSYWIEIKETGLKVQKLADWAIRRFNTEERLKTDGGMNVRNVWIKSQDEKK